jgi:hypothetical protein
MAVIPVTGVNTFTTAIQGLQCQMGDMRLQMGDMASRLTAIEGRSSPSALLFPQYDLAGYRGLPVTAMLTFFCHSYRLIN